VVAGFVHEDDVVAERRWSLGAHRLQI
jgi:hypothetical protein